jgi:RNA polymerase sigma factor (sigma-70 family)
VKESKNWQHTVSRAQQGDMAAFEEIVWQFKDMAVGYAFSILKDFQLAEDAAQEAFVQAYQDLPKLRESRAFPAWFRRIVFKYCDRYRRKKCVLTIPLEPHIDPPTGESSPLQKIQQQETRQAIMDTIKALPDKERSAVALFYINGYSLAEVGSFLEVPISTVKNRLFAARKKLKQRMVQMVEKTLKQNAPGMDFSKRVRNVLEGVPPVSFKLHTREDDGLPRCPEGFPFPSCLRSALVFLGDDHGFREIQSYGQKWRLDNAYVLLMGTTGAAFRLSWKPDWHLGNPSLFLMSDDPFAPMRHGLEAVGCDFEILQKEDDGHNENYFRRRIIESIRQAGRPVLACGVVGPPVYCLVVGYDDDGDVLIGWSFFQNFPEFNQGIEFEPSGYFRKREWEKDTHNLIIIGEKHPGPPLPEVYRDSLAWAVKVVNTPLVQGDCQNGLAAYNAWANALQGDNEFSSADKAKLWQYFDVHMDATGTVAEGRWYAAQYLQRVSEAVPSLTENLKEAGRCYEEEHRLMWQIWEFIGGPSRSEESARKLAQPEIRKQMVPLILKAREYDAEAIGYIETALKK